VTLRAKGRWLTAAEQGTPKPGETLRDELEVQTSKAFLKRVADSPQARTDLDEPPALNVFQPNQREPRRLVEAAR
jgi:hypothetical protein